MRKLSLYVLAAFLRPLAAGAGALVSLVMMADLMERLDKFITGGSTPMLVVEYLLALIPLRLMQILPVAALLAALLSLGGLSDRKEYIAAMGGGVHPWRFVRPILWAGAALALLCLAVGEYVTPAAARKARRIWSEDVRHDTRQTRFQNVTAAGDEGIFYSVGEMDTAEGWMEDVVVDRTQEGRPLSQIHAARADWLGNRWALRNGVERTFGPDGLTLAKQKRFILKEMKTHEGPADLVPPQEDTDALGYMPLKRHIRRLKALGQPTRRLEVDLHMKLALPWANLVVLLLGIPLALQKEGGKVKAVGFALAAAFLYFGLMQVGRALGQKPWCAPWVGAWMANLFFLTTGGFMYSRMRRLS
jgi:lipopolysaccharide export system permease protein